MADKAKTEAMPDQPGKIQDIAGNDSSKRTASWAVVIGALGVVYGDLGTSPLYAFRECFRGSHHLEPIPANILGILSLVFWSLTIIISVKYLMLVLRADNRGEGGILALMALVTGGAGRVRPARVAALTAMGIFGAALLYGDGAITPAISVLSAVEGLNVATRVFEPYVVALSVAILVFLFMIQRRGTGRIGAMFGPIMLAWFAVIGLLGLIAVTRQPGVLWAVNPLHAVRMMHSEGWRGFMILGTVFLAVTGGEALYADLGHFGKRPIRWGWYGVAMPGLLLNYFGQGAFLLEGPTQAENLFYRLAPSWGLYPLVILSTMATIIASQAIITGSFSLARQAVQLGLWPRVRIEHTSNQMVGQIYVPLMNWTLLVCTVGLVLGFQESGQLAGAYGIAVSATMLITTILITLDWKRFFPGKWSKWLRLGALALLAVDAVFLASNSLKVLTSGWVPLAFAIVLYTLVSVWRHGRATLRKNLDRERLGIEPFARSVAESHPLRVPGTAIFLSSNVGSVPRALLHNYKHNQVLHEHTILVSAETVEVPHVGDDRLVVRSFGQGIYSIRVTYGFSEVPNIPHALKMANLEDVDLSPGATTFFLGKETLVSAKRPQMTAWRRVLFAFMSRNALDPTLFFHLPPNRVVELGAQIEL